MTKSNELDLLMKQH